LLRLLAPFTPHITQCLWESFHFGEDILKTNFPLIDEKALVSDSFTLIVQINGKLRAKLDISSKLSPKEIEDRVIAHEIVSKCLAGKTVKQAIYVPKKLMNIVVGA
jgi:leucyl-tRNA synthetase